MLPEELKRQMKFSHPEENVSMRNRNYRWTQPTYEIKNIRRDAEDPNNTTVYYEDVKGNKYKTNAQMFVERFGDFYIESSIKHAIKLLAQVPGYDSPTPAVENTNPASIPRSCPNCGYMAMGSEINSALEQDENELKCPRCGFSINIAPDEQFLMAREKMSKLKSAVEKFAQFSPVEKINFFEMGIPRQRVSQILGQTPLQGTYRITEDSILFDDSEDAANIQTYLMTAKKKQSQWKEHVMDMSDDLYFPSDEETEDPIMRRIRELEEELGLDALDLSDMPGMEEDYLAYLEDEAGMVMGAKKAQTRERYPEEYDIILPEYADDGDTHLAELIHMLSQYYSGQGDPIYAFISRGEENVSLVELQTIESELEDIAGGKYLEQADEGDEQVFDDQYTAQAWLPTIKKLLEELPEERWEKSYI